MATTEQGWTILIQRRGYTAITNESNIIRFDLRGDNFGVKVFDSRKDEPMYWMKELNYDLHCGNGYSIERFIEEMKYVEDEDSGLYLVNVGAFTLTVTLHPGNGLVVETFVDKWEV